MAGEIPVVDFEGVFSCRDLSTCPQLKQLHSAFSTVGFVFITNHGIPKQLIKEVNSVSLKFFSNPVEVKKTYLYRHGINDTRHNGYICLGQERENLTTPGDQSEAFDICSIEHCNYPDEVVPEFRLALAKLYRGGITLALKILEMIGHALSPEDPSYFVRKHKKIGIGCEENYSSARVLHYPPLPSSLDHVQVSDDQVLLRKHEHVDYGSLTLLFPDPKVGGLQIKRTGGGWIDAPLLEDAVLVNLGAFMQHWTSDLYMATPHRVIIPNDALSRTSRRQTCAVFIHPDVETVVECIDGSNKYPPVVAGKHTRNRIEDTLHTKYEE